MCKAPTYSYRYQCSIETCRKFFTTNAALNYHVKSKHAGASVDASGQEIDDDDVGEDTVEVPLIQEVSVGRGSKRKFPKVVYVLPGKLGADGEDQSKKPKVEPSQFLFIS